MKRIQSRHLYLRVWMPKDMCHLPYQAGTEERPRPLPPPPQWEAAWIKSVGLMNALGASTLQKGRCSGLQTGVWVESRRLHYISGRHYWLPFAFCEVCCEFGVSLTCKSHHGIMKSIMTESYWTKHEDKVRSLEKITSILQHNNGMLPQTLIVVMLTLPTCLSVYIVCIILHVFQSASVSEFKRW